MRSRQIRIQAGFNQFHGTVYDRISAPWLLRIRLLAFQAQSIRHRIAVDLRCVGCIIARLPGQRNKLPPALRVACVNDANLSHRSQWPGLRGVRASDERPDVHTTASSQHMQNNATLRSNRKQATTQSITCIFYVLDWSHLALKHNSISRIHAGQIAKRWIPESR